MLCARLRINILWFWNRRVTPLPPLEGIARYSLHLCLVHPKLCGIYYAMPTITPAMLECVSVCIFMCACAVCFYETIGGWEERKERMFVCGSFMEERVLM